MSVKGMRRKRNGGKKDPRFLGGNLTKVQTLINKDVFRGYSLLPYTEFYGFRRDSQVARLVDYVCDEFRAKYGCDYRLKRVGKNRFVVVPGDCGDYGVRYVLESVKLFGTTITAA